jgi:hypothetical protein
MRVGTVKIRRASRRSYRPRCLSNALALRRALPMRANLGLLPALRIYVEAFSKRSGMQVQTELPITYPQLPRELEMAVFHVVQESLTKRAAPFRKSVGENQSQRHSDRDQGRRRECSNRGCTAEQRRWRVGEDRS